MEGVSTRKTDDAKKKGKNLKSSIFIVHGEWDLVQRRRRDVVY
jgi:hypothetical protein